MQCDVCGGLNGHIDGCPESTFEEKANEPCFMCDNEIFFGEKYIENVFGDKIHYECLVGCTTREILDALGFEIKTKR